MNPTRITIAAAFLLAAVPAAHAESFDVTARIFCPASWDAAANRLDETFATATQSPCAGIRVVALDADPAWDEYCGAAYTDSRGIVRLRGQCGDALGGRPDVYLKVEGRSASGFSVGVIDPNPLQRILDSLGRLVAPGVPLPIPIVDHLRSHQTFAWIGSERLASEGQRLDYGDLAIGGAFADGTVSTMAARQFWAAHYTMLRLRAGTRYRPMDFSINVSAPIGSPTTLYDTVIVSFRDNPEPQASGAVRAMAHEIGHVLYNTYHSGIVHWLLDAPDYMTGHAPCDDDHFQTLAWYEGFADFVRDYVYQQWDWNASDWSNAPPFRGCAVQGDGTLATVPRGDGTLVTQQDMHFEGNVAGLLNNIFFGPVRLAQRTEIGLPKAADFTCAAGQRRIVTASGAIECEGEAPVGCIGGRLAVDHSGVIDQCLETMRDPACAPFEECEPVDRVVASRCASGSAVRRSGADACLVRRPAQHIVPNGTPAARPDGTPDMVLGRNRAGERAWFSLPSLDQPMKWVADANRGAHRASEFWQGWMRPSCQPRNGLRYQYCHPHESASFREELQKLDPAFN